jgi:hypothetical protein
MSNKYDEINKQSNYIPKSKQDLEDHLTMVDRDLQHLFGYVNSIVPYAETISSNTVSIIASILSSGIYTIVAEVRTADPVSPLTGQIWFRSDL